jgi:hypothetical protein
MHLKEKARQNGEPIPNAILAQDSAESNLSPLYLQVFRLTQRCAISATAAAILAPFVFGEVSQ